MWIFIITLITGLVIILFARKFQNNHRLSTYASEKASFAEQVLYTFEITGEDAYQPHLRKIAGNNANPSKLIEATARVVSEPSNSLDIPAIRIEIQGGTVGHLKEQDAKQLAGHRIDQKVAAVIHCTGLDQNNQNRYTVKLAVKRVDDLR